MILGEQNPFAGEQNPFAVFLSKFAPRDVAVVAERRRADWSVDAGPGAGVNRREILYSGQHSPFVILSNRPAQISYGGGRGRMALILWLWMTMLFDGIRNWTYALANLILNATSNRLAMRSDLVAKRFSDARSGLDRTCSTTSCGGTSI